MLHRGFPRKPVFVASNNLICAWKHDMCRSPVLAQTSRHFILEHSIDTVSHPVGSFFVVDADKAKDQLWPIPEV